MTATPAPLSAHEAARTELERRNKALVTRFYDEVHGQGRLDALGQFVADTLIQHDPLVADGRQGLADKLAAQVALSPRPVATIKHILADGPYVVVHTHLSATPQDEATGSAHFDLYRLHAGLIVEQWSLRQDVPATTPSGHTLFDNAYRHTPSAQPASRTQREQHKALIRKLVTVLFTGHEASIVDTYWKADLAQHNPMAPDGIDMLKMVTTLPKPTPFGAWNTRLVIAEGDHVFSLSQLTSAEADLRSDFNGMAAGDFFLMVDGQIAEHWDVLSPIPESSKNGHSPFSELFVPLD